MKKWRPTLAASVLALGLTACAPFHSIPPMPANLAEVSAPDQDKADASNRALWGIYADLAGTSRFSPRNGGTRLDWRWIRPGWILEETAYVKGVAEPLNTYILWRGEQAGVLYFQSSGLMGMAWKGTVQRDGSVLFEGAGPMSFPYQAVLAKDGAFEVRAAEIKEGALVSVRELVPDDRYEKTSAALSSGGTKAAASAASAPVAAAQSANTAGTPTSGSVASGSSRSGGIVLTAAGLRAGEPKFDAAEQQQRNDALAKADEAASQAEIRLRTAQETLAAAQAESKKTENALKAMNDLQASFRPAPKTSEPGDFWSYCWYSVIQVDGKTSHTFVTNLINERIWTEPWPFLSPSGRRDFENYDGPNTPYRVEKRFEKAMQTSGLLPQHTAYASDCATYISLKSARDSYDGWRHNEPKPIYVVWKSLENEHLQGSMKLPTAEEAARLKQEAKDAEKRLKDAQAALRQEERQAALRKEDAQRARDCAAGQLKACPRGTKN